VKRERFFPLVVGDFFLVFLPAVLLANSEVSIDFFQGRRSSSLPPFSPTAAPFFPGTVLVPPQGEVVFFFSDKKHRDYGEEHLPFLPSVPREHRLRRVLSSHASQVSIGFSSLSPPARCVVGAFVKKEENDLPPLALVAEERVFFSRCFFNCPAVFFSMKEGRVFFPQ